jgi:hypothetical protein
VSLGPKQNAVVRAGTYTRISSDPSGQRAGVERQRIDCEALCVARGWPVGEVFEDNDARHAADRTPMIGPPDGSSGSRHTRRAFGIRRGTRVVSPDFYPCAGIRIGKILDGVSSALHVVVLTIPVFGLVAGQSCCVRAPASS